MPNYMFVSESIRKCLAFSAILFNTPLEISLLECCFVTFCSVSQLVFSTNSFLLSPLLLNLTVVFHLFMGIGDTSRAYRKLRCHQQSHEFFQPVRLNSKNKGMHNTEKMLELQEQKVYNVIRVMHFSRNYFESTEYADFVLDS